MVDISDRVRARMKALGVRQAELGRRAGVTQQSIQHLIAGKIKKPRFIVELAKALETSPEYLMGTDGDQVINVPTGHWGTPPPTGPEDLPIRGRVKGGNVNDAVFNNGEIYGYTARPSILKNVAEAYAAYVVGDSMEPRYFEGEIVHVHPYMPVHKGDFVVVQLTSKGDTTERRYMVKRFVSYGDVLALEQYNPPDELTFSRESVDCIHLIVGAARG